MVFLCSVSRSAVGLVAAVLLQEDAQRAPQPGIVVVVAGECAERLDDPGPQKVDRPRHEGHWGNLAEAGHYKA